MTNGLTLRARILLSSVSIIACGAPAAAAQTATPNVEIAATDAQAPQDETGTGGGEIVVTAQRRSQSINSVGLAISAASADQLARNGVADTADLVKVVPGLSFTTTSTSTPVYTLRGVGFYENALAASPAVSVYVDEAPLPFATMTQGSALDLERVEVLKGPQGTLYGQNSTGGAINYIAAKPTSTWQAGLDVGFSRFATADFGGFVSGPLSETLGVRVAAKATYGGDWQRSTTRDDRLGQVAQLAGRILLNWSPSDRFTMVLTASGWQDRGETLAPQVVEVIPTVPALIAPNLRTDYPAAHLDARDADWTPGKDYRADSRFYALSARMDYELNQAVQLTSITAYQNLSRDVPSDADGTDQAIVDYSSIGSIKSFSQELRVAAQFAGVNLIVGGNYSTARVVDDVIGDYEFLSVNQPIPVVPRFRAAPIVSQSKLDTYAAFANVEAEVADGLTLVAGTRYTQADNRYRGCTLIGDTAHGQLFMALQSALRGAIGLSTNAVPLAVGDCGSLNPVVFTPQGTVANPTEAFRPAYADRSLSENNLSIRAGISYKLAGGGLAYASYNRGYKSGSFPVYVASSNATLVPVTQERVEAYEAGLKLPLFDRAVQLNVAGFYYDYRDKQIRARFRDQFFGLLQTLVNVPKSRVVGLEVELQARPIAGLDFSASATYSDTKVQRYTGFDVGTTPVDLSGSQFPYTPELTAVADVQYTFDLNDRHQAFVGANGRYSGEAYGSFAEVEPLRIRAYAVLDLRAGIQAPDGAWRLSVFGRNITNEYYWNSVFRSTDTTLRYAGRPITYGISFSSRFGS